MTVLEFLDILAGFDDGDVPATTVVYIDESSGDEIEIVDAVLEHGKIKLISKFTKDESGAT